MTAYRPAGPLFTDLYELTMAATYFEQRMFSKATFSAFVRKDPQRNYYIAAGLTDVLDELASFRFDAAALAYLQQTQLFKDDFLNYLAALRFSGSVFAMPEGTVFFPDEPLLEITAPVIEAQLIETFVLNCLGFQSLIASKAARCVQAAAGRPLIDFSLRRTPGQDAGLKAARSSYIAGFAATSNVLAGQRYELPISGTMAHSYVQAFQTEADAFSAYAASFPGNSVFLIDTYDTRNGARNAVRVARAMQQRGEALVGVRLDSGDVVAESRQVRKILDEAGLPDVKIFASGGFDEFEIEKIRLAKAPVDAFGVGTRVGVSADAPFLDIVYKLVRFDGRNVCKHSPGKQTLAGPKQVFRKQDPTGRYTADIIGTRDESFDGADALLKEVMRGGRRLFPAPALSDIRCYFKKDFKKFPPHIKSIRRRSDYPVTVSSRLKAVQAAVQY